MKHIFDIFLLLILFLVTFISTKRGFVRSVWASVTIIGAFAVSFAFGSTLGEYICRDYILPYVTEYTVDIINGMVTSAEGNYNVSELFTTLPREFVLLAEKCGANIDSLCEQYTSAVSISQEQLYDLAESVALPISRTISNAVGIIVLFLTAVIVLAIIGLVVKIISKIPIIHTIDLVLGFVFGLLKGVIIICMLCVVAAIFVECEFMSGEIGAYFISLTEHSYLFKLFCTVFPFDFINIG